MVKLTHPRRGEAFTSPARVLCALELLRIDGQPPTVGKIRQRLGGGSRSTILYRLSQLRIQRAYDVEEPGLGRLPSDLLIVRILVAITVIERQGTMPTIDAVRRLARVSPTDASYVLRTIRGRLKPPPVRYRCRSRVEDGELIVIVGVDQKDGSGTPADGHHVACHPEWVSAIAVDTRVAPNTQPQPPASSESASMDTPPRGARRISGAGPAPDRSSVPPPVPSAARHSDLHPGSAGDLP